jgi:excinuclease ABC subunit A
MSEIDNLDPKKYIIIKGARVNNLQNLSVAIPRNKLIVVTGVSGSGKSTLVNETL